MHIVKPSLVASLLRAFSSCSKTNTCGIPFEKVLINMAVNTHTLAAYNSERVLLNIISKQILIAQVF